MTDQNPESRPQIDRHPTGQVNIAQGRCNVLFACDVGLAIDLEQAQRRITANQQRGHIRHRRRTPNYFEYQPAPLRVALTVPPIQLGRYAAATDIEATIYDFGAVSVQFELPLTGPLSDLLDLSDAIWDHPELNTQATRIVEELVQSIGPAINKPTISDRVEDYVIYQIEQLEPAISATELIAAHGGLLARILRAEAVELSDEEVRDALSCQISFTPTDRTLIDWNAALLLDNDADDVRAVLEFANVELLELRYLDDRLDEALDRAYETSAQRRLLGMFLGARAADLRRVAEMQMDSALLYEGVNNALKLLGDQYLARVHRLVSQRFHLQDWDRSILRKLQTIESIFQRIADWNAIRRMEVLEWIIIILIAVSIIMPFIPGVPGY